MQVYFLRHAHAEDSDGSKPDAQRQLTERGISHTRRLAALITALNIKPDRLYSSPLVRARQTADIIAEALATKPEIRRELGPGFNLAALSSILTDAKTAETVMIVGHEPDFSKVIADCIGGGRVVMKKGGLARVDVQTHHQVLHGELAWLLNPKLLDGLD